MLCMTSSIFEKIVISIIKSFFLHCQPQMSFSQLQHSSTGIMPGERERNSMKDGFKRRLFREGVAS